VFAKLEEFILEKLSETKLPSLTAAVVKGEEVVWARAFGFKDVARGLPATTKTLYGIGSVTKSFTALAIMQLVEQGKLRLDDPVDLHVPFPVKPQGERVTILHLLTHSSGIPALAYAEAVIRGRTGAQDNWLPIATYSDLVTFMQDANDWTLFKPGERWFYLNEGYAALGAVIEKCAGVSYEDYVRTHILLPLGMERSFFGKAAVEKDSDVAVPYVITRTGEQMPSSYAYGGLTADGALISNIHDLARYASMYLGGGKFGQTRVLGEEGIKAMQEPRIALPYQGNFGPRYYALGLFNTPAFYGRTLIDHGGSVLVATAFMGFVPEEGLGVVLLANGSGYPLAQIGQYTLCLLLGQDTAELPFIALDRELAALTGVYETYKGTMRVQVKKAGSLLMLENKDKYNDTTAPLIAENLAGAHKRFYTLNVGVKVPVEFTVSEKGIELIHERYLLRRVGKLG
jgi:CubicO group peptidase (beta-lactamase class C family)